PGRFGRRARASLTFTGRDRREAAGVGLAPVQRSWADIHTPRRSRFRLIEKIPRRFAKRYVDADMPVEIERGGQCVEGRIVRGGHDGRLPAPASEGERRAVGHFRGGCRRDIIRAAFNAAGLHD
ncbi:MAG: hypothetical protein QM651_08200, partial [Rhodoblastus sp.]